VAELQAQQAQMDPSTMGAKLQEAEAQINARKQYTVTVMTASSCHCLLWPRVMNCVPQASIQLKNEGNQLHSQGKYQEACAKYERAKSNVEGENCQESRDLHRACTLNLSSCYLNLNQLEACIAQCDEVLSAGEVGARLCLSLEGYLVNYLVREA
jgi:tetratricopeptide (TPR) repeat protein